MNISNNRRAKQRFQSEQRVGGREKMLLWMNRSPKRTDWERTVYGKKRSTCAWWACDNMNGTFVESSKIKANQARKDRFGLPDKKECSLNQKKEVLKNDKKSKFSKLVSAWFLSKNRTFYHQCFLGKTSQRGSCCDILEK